MSAGGHTPGTWQFVKRPVEDATEPSRVSCEIHTTWNHSQLGGPAPIVCLGVGVAKPGTHVYSASIHISDADGALLAAAPQLADALDAMLREHDRTNNHRGDCANAYAARAALRAAGRLP